MNMAKMMKKVANGVKTMVAESNWSCERQKG